MRFHVRPRWILIVLLVPLVILGFLALATRIYGSLRYDPVYFTDAYADRYSTPGETARTLEAALQIGDAQLLADLQGLRWPAKLETAPSMIFVMLLERTDRYFTYLYFDIESYERHPHHVEEVNGRWVVSPEDWYYYMCSGRWRSVFMPLAVIWWLIGFVAIALVWIFRVSENMRQRLYGE